MDSEQKPVKKPPQPGPRLTLMLALCFTWMAPTSLPADVLVTKDGETIETQGPYEVKGRRITYTNHIGRLTMIRTDAIDLEASARATEEAAKPKVRDRGPKITTREEDALAFREAMFERREDHLEKTEGTNTTVIDFAKPSNRVVQILFEAVNQRSWLERYEKARWDDYVNEVAAVVRRHDLRVAEGWVAAAPAFRDIARRIEKRVYRLPEGTTSERRRALQDLGRMVEKVASVGWVERPAGATPESDGWFEGEATIDGTPIEESLPDAGSAGAAHPPASANSAASGDGGQLARMAAAVGAAEGSTGTDRPTTATTMVPVVAPSVQQPAKKKRVAVETIPRAAIEAASRYRQLLAE